MSENQFGGCGFQYSFGSKLRTYIHTDIYIYICAIYTLDVWCFPVFGRHRTHSSAHTNRGSVADKGGVTYIAAHSSPTRRRGVALPEMVLQLG